MLYLVLAVVAVGLITMLAIGFWCGTARARRIVRQEYAFHCQFVVSRAVGLYSTIIERRLLWRSVDAETEWKDHQKRVEKRMQSLGMTE